MTAKKASEAGENPLVPNAKLKQMYTTMLEARVLEEAVAKKARGAKGSRRVASIRGQEAVRVSTAIELGPDDLVSDAAVSAGMGSILGGEAASLLKDFSKAKATKSGSGRLLRPIDDGVQRLRLAAGAALALKAQGRQGVVVAYARREEAGENAWKNVLSAASRLELPIIFVVLPGTGSMKKGDELAVVSEIAHEAGVPGMPVDACDAVALYRATQESLGRTRAGDGPVLIECVRWRIKGKRGVSDDPLIHLEEFLRAQKIATSAWLENASRAARRRLAAKKRASRKT
jgi:TPP-dependent pyruvate/acetoin dehydrogenase alpha subunit